MADIKTRNVVKDIKVFDKASTVGDKMKGSYVRTKNNFDSLTDEERNSPTDYAENNIRMAWEDTAAGVKNTTKTAYKKGRELYRTRRDIGKAKNSADYANKTVKRAKKSIKTAEQTSKMAIKTTKNAIKTAEEAVKLSVKAAKVTAQAAKATARAIVAALKVVAKAVVAAVKGIVTGVKALVAAIIAGGWVSVLIIVIICVVAMVIAYFGIFFSNEDTGTGMTIQTAMDEINTEYLAEIEMVKKENNLVNAEVIGLDPNWDDILAVYAVKIGFDPYNPQEMASMDESKKTALKAVFWGMVDISANKSVNTITIINKSPYDMAVIYGFDLQQNEILGELLLVK